MGKDYRLERIGRKENGRDGGCVGDGLGNRWLHHSAVQLYSTVKLQGEMVSNISMNGGGGGKEGWGEKEGMGKGKERL